MKYKDISLFTLFVLLILSGLQAQDPHSTQLLHARIIDADTQSPLAFASIGFRQARTGSISNEEGFFNIALPTQPDSLVIQFIGYKTYCQALPLADSSTIRLQRTAIALNEAEVFANMPSIGSILERVVARLDSNYHHSASKQQLFFRQTQKVDMPQLSAQLKKNKIPEINQALIDKTLQHIPKRTTSFSDLLTDVYSSAQAGDSLRLSPLRYVRLKDVEIAELQQMSNIMGKLLKNTKKDEYWKVRTGIIGQKVSVDTGSGMSKDSNMATRYQAHQLQWQLQNSHIQDNKLWSFIFKQSRYDYTIDGLGFFNDEQVYIIRFSPRGRGLYKGSMYISTNSYALLRADFGYAANKHGTHFNMLGIHFTEKALSMSVMYAACDGGYRLQYLSHKRGYSFGVDRNILFIKKRKRFLFDKTIFEAKARLQIESEVEEHNTVVVFDYEEIPQTGYQHVRLNKMVKPIEIEQYHDSLWANYPNIAPVQSLRNYKKQGLQP